MNTTRKKSVLDFAFILALFGVFAISAMFVIIFGANVYSKIADSSDYNYKARTAYYYITEKIRSHDKYGTIEVENSANTKSIGLIMYDNVDGEEYRTYIYYYDNALFECTLKADEPFSYDKGERLLQLKDFRSEIEGDKLIHLYLKDDTGYVTDFYVTTTVPLKDVTDTPIIGSEGPEKISTGKKDGMNQ